MHYGECCVCEGHFSYSETQIKKEGKTYCEICYEESKEKRRINHGCSSRH